MGKKGCILISCIIFILFIGSALAGSYDMQGTDPTNDVKDLENGGILTSDYPNLDIISAAVEENGDNIVFTLTVLGEIVPNDSNIRYVFRITSDETSNYVDLYFKNPYLSYVFRMDPYLKVDCTYVLNGDTVVITAPKTAFDDVSTPWSVTAKAKVYVSQDKVLDELVLSYETDSTDGSSSSSSTSNLPSFEAITIIIVLFMAILIIVAIVFVVWSKKKRSK